VSITVFASLYDAGTGLVLSLQQYDLKSYLFPQVGFLVRVFFDKGPFSAEDVGAGQPNVTPDPATHSLTIHPDVEAASGTTKLTYVYLNTKDPKAVSHSPTAWSVQLPRLASQCMNVPACPVRVAVGVDLASDETVEYSTLSVSPEITRYNNQPRWAGSDQYDFAIQGPVAEGAPALGETSPPVEVTVHSQAKEISLARLGVFGGIVIGVEASLLAAWLNSLGGRLMRSRNVATSEAASDPPVTRRATPALTLLVWLAICLAAFRHWRQRP